MFCTHCGAKCLPGARYCEKCGKPAPQPPVQPHAASQPDDLDRQLRGILPVNTSFWAIAAGYCALFSVLLVPAPLALILGVAGLIDIRNHPGRYGVVRAWLGVILGSLFTALGLVVLASAA